MALEVINCQSRHGRHHQNRLQKYAGVNEGAGHPEGAIEVQSRPSIHQWHIRQR